MLPDRGPARLAAWGAVAVAVALLHNRLWATFNLAFFTAISKNLGRNPFGNGFDGDYLLTNLTGPTLARVLHQTEPHEYARLHLVCGFHDHESSCQHRSFRLPGPRWLRCRLS